MTQVMTKKFITCKYDSTWTFWAQYQGALRVCSIMLNPSKDLFVNEKARRVWTHMKNLPFWVFNVLSERRKEISIQCWKAAVKVCSWLYVCVSITKKYVSQIIDDDWRMKTIGKERTFYMKHQLKLVVTVEVSSVSLIMDELQG